MYVNFNQVFIVQTLLRLKLDWRCMSDIRNIGILTTGGLNNVPRSLIRWLLELTFSSSSLCFWGLVSAASPITWTSKGAKPPSTRFSFIFAAPLAVSSLTMINWNYILFTLVQCYLPISWNASNIFLSIGDHVVRNWRPEDITKSYIF